MCCEARTEIRRHNKKSHESLGGNSASQSSVIAVDLKGSARSRNDKKAVVSGTGQQTSTRNHELLLLLPPQACTAVATSAA